MGFTTHRKVQFYRCQPCGHEWQPRVKTAMPRICPKCKRRDWQKPRKPEPYIDPMRTGHNAKRDPT